MTRKKRGSSLRGVRCDIDSCEAQAKRHTDFGRLCTKHYKRVVRNGDPGIGKQKHQPEKCINCGESHNMHKGGHGYCSICYGRWEAHGDPNVLLRPQSWGIDVCTVEGCDNKHDSHGYCLTHAIRFRKYGDPLAYSPDAPHLRKVDREQLCLVQDCDEPIGDGSNGMCRSHYRKTRHAARPEHYRAKVNARRRRLREATPPWADLEKIDAIYRNCPPDYEVDHVIPLLGKLICGLHVENNLQYLPVKENRRKSNRVGRLS